MNLINNYSKDLIKSRNQFLLIELNKNDLTSFGKNGLNKSIALADQIYNSELQNEKNLIFINCDDYYQKNENNSIILLDKIIEEVRDDIGNQKNIEVIKSSISGVLSYFTGGIVKDSISDFVDYGTEQISDFISNSSKDFLSYISDELEFNDAILNSIISRIDNLSENSLSSIMDKLITTKLYLSKEAKEKLKNLSNKFNNELTSLEIFNLIIEIILSIALESKKIIFINNPHKLDSNSLSILSLLFSYAKNLKGESTSSNGLGISIVYCYSDNDFQPYDDIKEENKYILTKKLLDEQRRFIQRYGMLERPTSDIPNVAIKSSFFVGREKELNNLLKKFEFSKSNPNLKSIEVIVADPGIGKTKLIEKHLKEIRKSQEYGEKIIQLTLLNQVGHTSINVGLASLKDSILKEANRLNTLKTLENKIKKLEDKIIDFTKEKTVDIIEDLLGVNNIIETSKSIHSALNNDKDINRFKRNSNLNLNNDSQNTKIIEFKKITKAILELQKISKDSLPIVLFVDDIQWIDEYSAEFLLTHFTKNINIYIVATQRKSDATTSLKLAIEKKELNKYKISLLQQIGIKSNHERINLNENSILEANIYNLSGLNEDNLIELISLTVYRSNTNDEKREKDKTLAKNIIQYLNDDTNTAEVNTLFAIETINILCDNKFYKYNEIKELLILSNPLRYNDSINDFSNNLTSIFKLIKKTHQTAFDELNLENENQQKFNLMSYAILEERLHILREYFDDYGDAAINTLKLSSLISSPFNSDIIKFIIDSIGNSEVKLPKSFKEKFYNHHLSTLERNHYDIIEEIYEILSRHISLNKYVYRHNLFESFFETQFFNLINKIEKDDSNKNIIFKTILEYINTYEKNLVKTKYHKLIKLFSEYDFINDLDIEKLSNKEYNDRLEIEYYRLNLSKKVYEHYNKSDYWLNKYIESMKIIMKFHTVFRNFNDIYYKFEKEILTLKKELSYQKNDSSLRNYIELLLLLSDGKFYFEINNYIEYENEIINHLEYEYECENLLIDLYEKDPNKWSFLYLEIIRRRACFEHLDEDINKTYRYSFIKLYQIHKHDALEEFYYISIEHLSNHFISILEDCIESKDFKKFLDFFKKYLDFFIKISLFEDNLESIDCNKDRMQILHINITSDINCIFLNSIEEIFNQIVELEHQKLFLSYFCNSIKYLYENKPKVWEGYFQHLKCEYEYIEILCDRAFIVDHNRDLHERFNMGLQFLNEIEKRHGENLYINFESDRNGHNIYLISERYGEILIILFNIAIKFQSHELIIQIWNKFDNFYNRLSVFNEYLHNNYISMYKFLNDTNKTI